MDTTKFKSVALSIETYKQLKERSEQDDRSLSGSIRHLLKESDELRKLRER
jgi:macrodomain Ter protein organizer (MatP/YcbG family)